jgi:hypothetical protein
MPSVARTGDRILVSAVDRLGNRKEISVPVLGIDFLPISRDHLRDANGRSLNLDSANAYWSRTPIVTVRLPEFPEGAERMVWRGVESDTRGERTRATAANPIRFTIPKDGILDVSWEWVTSTGLTHDAGRTPIALDQGDPELLPESSDIRCAPGAKIVLEAKDAASCLRSLAYDIGGQKFTHEFGGKRQATVTVTHPGGDGKYNLICTVEDIAGATISKSYILTTEVQAETLNLEYGTFGAGFVALPPGEESLEIAKTEMDLGSFRAFYRATENNEEFWRTLGARIATVDRKLTTRNANDVGHPILKQAIRTVIKRNEGMPDSHPVRFATDDVAMVCASYFGARIPTVKEWRAAARGSWDGLASNPKSIFPIIERAELTLQNARNYDLHVKRGANKPLPVMEYKDDITVSGVFGMAGNVREIVEFREFVFRVAGGSWRTELVDIGTIGQLIDDEDVGFRIIRKRSR